MSLAGWLAAGGNIAALRSNSQGADAILTHILCSILKFSPQNDQAMSFSSWRNHNMNIRYDITSLAMGSLISTDNVSQSIGATTGIVGIGVLADSYFHNWWLR